MLRTLWRQPAVWVSCLFCIVIYWMYWEIVRQTGGLFVYPLDDSYIHLALARNLAAHGGWGIRAGTFDSASSSPGWTLLLALSDVVAGPRLLNGLLLDMVCGIAVFFTVDYGLRTFVRDVSVRLRYFTLIAVLFCTPLPNLTMLGMEHVAQTLTVLLLVILSVQIISLPLASPAPWGTVSGLMAAAVCAGALRYETVFAVVPICLCLLLRRRIGVAALTAFGSAVGPAGFGFYFHAHSGTWLPFSVIVKSNNSFLSELLHPTFNHRRFASLIVFTGLIWLLRTRRVPATRPSQLLLGMSFCIALLHLVFAPIGWLMRYESYLVALILFSFCVAIAEVSSWRALVKDCIEGPAFLRLGVVATAIVGLAACAYIAKITVNGIVEPVEASVDRYYEHIQMARFVAANYDRQSVVVNDVGALAYYTNAHLLDLMGLGSPDVAQAIHKHHPFDAADFSTWADSHHASLAILLSDWSEVARRTPPNWIKVETWLIPRDVEFGARELSFYALAPEEIPAVCSSLAKFSLPAQDKATSLTPVCQSPITAGTEPPGKKMSGEPDGAPTQPTSSSIQ